MFLKRYGLEYRKKEFNYLTEQQKKKIFELACKHKRIYTLAAEVGAPPYNVRNFLIANDLPYKGKVEKETKLEYFSWEQFPEGIF